VAVMQYEECYDPRGEAATLTGREVTRLK